MSAAVHFYVYLLIDPRDNSPFYVGKGKGRRFAAHEIEWRKGQVRNAAKFTRIGEINAAGRSVVVEFVAKDLSEDEALKLERQKIAEIGRANLTNVVPGQKTEHAKAVAEAQHYLAHARPFLDWRADPRYRELESKTYFDVTRELTIIANSKCMADIVRFSRENRSK